MGFLTASVHFLHSPTPVCHCFHHRCSSGAKAAVSWDRAISNGLPFPWLLMRPLRRISVQHYQLEHFDHFNYFLPALCHFPLGSKRSLCQIAKLLNGTTARACRLPLPSQPEEQAARDNQCLDVISTQMRSSSDKKEMEKDFFIYFCLVSRPGTFFFSFFLESSHQNCSVLSII